MSPRFEGPPDQEQINKSPLKGISDDEIDALVNERLDPSGKLETGSLIQKPTAMRPKEELKKFSEELKKMKDLEAEVTEETIEDLRNKIYGQEASIGSGPIINPIIRRSLHEPFKKGQEGGRKSLDLGPEASNKLMRYARRLETQRKTEEAMKARLRQRTGESLEIVKQQQLAKKMLESAQKEEKRDRLTERLAKIVNKKPKAGKETSDNDTQTQ